MSRELIKSINHHPFIANPFRRRSANPDQTVTQYQNDQITAQEVENRASLLAMDAKTDRANASASVTIGGILCSLGAVTANPVLVSLGIFMIVKGAANFARFKNEVNASTNLSYLAYQK